MNLLSVFRRRNSAPVARERLQVLLAHERAFVGESDLLAVLQEEIIAVIARHVTIERDKAQIKLDRTDIKQSFNVKTKKDGHFLYANLPTGTAVSARMAQCPKCGEASLIRIEGCDQCTSCGYSKCG